MEKRNFITIRVTEEEKQAVKTKSKSYGLSISTFIRLLLRDVKLETKQHSVNK